MRQFILDRLGNEPELVGLSEAELDAIINESVVKLQTAFGLTPSGPSDTI